MKESLFQLTPHGKKLIFGIIILNCFYTFFSTLEKALNDL